VDADGRSAEDCDEYGAVYEVTPAMSAGSPPFFSAIHGLNTKLSGSGSVFPSLLWQYMPELRSQLFQ
jgi:hypothetical protein